MLHADDDRGSRSPPLDRTATRERNEWLWLHNEARQARPSAQTLYHLSRLYRGARFRVHEEVVNLYKQRLTICRPVIEVLTEANRRIQWVAYVYLDHEESTDSTIQIP